jgi:RNA polymerase sigma-70 factor, ECF subfamily
VARRRLAGERPNHTIQPPALVNEAYVRLANERGMQWESRSHFLAVAAQLMRFILVDDARKRRYQKRGGDRQIVALEMDVADVGAESAPRIDHALSDLARVDERKARVVELRIFAGLSVDECARLLGVSPETIGRDWRFARAWLGRELER